MIKTKSKICALILTYNEELNIKDCIESLNFVDTVFVYDSYSTDKTLSIAKSLGAVVAQRKFDNYSSQRNKAFNIIPSEFKWILMFDADERVTVDLKNEILNKINNVQENISAFRLRRKDIIFGKWLKRSTGYPTWAPRVFKNNFVTVKRDINEQYDIEGSYVNLKEHFLHFPLNKGIHWWLHKHNNYSSMEAVRLIDENKTYRLDFKNLFSKDHMLRRKAQKSLFYRLPFRPQLIFIMLFVVRLGFLDGRSGYKYCKLRKTYEWMINLKISEHLNNSNS